MIFHMAIAVVGRSPDRSTSTTAGLQWGSRTTIEERDIRGFKTVAERYRIADDAYVYFVTYSVVEWLPVFVSDEPCQIVTGSLNFCIEKKGLRVSGYVIMPTHMHAIVFDRSFDNESLESSRGEPSRNIVSRGRLSDFMRP